MPTTITARMIRVYQLLRVMHAPRLKHAIRRHWIEPRARSCKPAGAAAPLLALLVAGCALPAARTPAGAPTSPSGAADVAAAALLREPGVSRTLAAHRARTLSNVAYDLRLDVTDSVSAPGHVEIRFDRTADAGALLRDCRGTALGAATVNGRAFVPAVVQDHIEIPAPLLRTGGNVVTLEFTSAIAPAGTAIIRYDDARDDARYLYTLLVPADAQQLFPGFDQPDLKARVTLTIDAPRGWEVVANGPLRARSALDGAASDGGESPGTARGAAAGVDRWRFAETEPISTYLIAFAAGPWQVIEDRTTGVTTGTEDRAMRLYVRRARAAQVDADTIFKENAEALVWLERYFDLAYPFGKLDLVFAPAFPFGGMEHVGAIFYNESRFIFTEPPTPTARWGRAATIYHEIAHQWFGDLVTMEWFDDLWLKESFATYMAARLQDDLYPDAGAWTRFYLRTKPAAYAVDATTGTSPVWQELPNLDMAKSNYGPIVYNKAPAVLRQLEYLVGEPAFRDGVRQFLRRHAYGNATWRELLGAIGERAGVDLDAFGTHYMLRAGMPLVRTELVIEDGRIRELALVQRPARELPGDIGGAWPGRVRVRLGYTGGDDVLIPVRFDGERTVVREAAGLPAPAYAFANDGDYGYGIFLPDARSAAWLLEHAASLDDELQRAMAWGALWDLVREAELAPRLFLEASLAALPAEREETISGTLLGRALTAAGRYMPESEAAAYRPALERLLLTRAGDADLPYGLRRASLDALLGTARTETGLAALRELLDGRRDFAGEPLGQPSRWAAVRRLVALGEPDGAERLRAEAARDTTPEAARSAFIAGAAVPGAAVKAEYYRRYFEDASLNEEWVSASLGAFNDPLHEALVLPWLGRALERAEWLRDNRRIFFLPSWIEAFVGGHRSPEALAIVDAFLAGNPELPIDIRRRVLQARDELERTVRILGGG
jgi:aminopeptidase N